METPQRPDASQQQRQAAQINRALGVFLLFFSAIILVSILFTETPIGKLTNLAAAGVIGLVGGALVYRGRVRPSGPQDLR